MKQFTAIVIGAGLRGIAYTDGMKDMPNEFKVVGVAEPVEDRRNYIQEKHGIAPENVYDDWKGILSREKMADVAIIATMDRDHYAPTMAAIEKGYHILLEKPISPVPKECLEIAAAAEKKGVHIIVCHVLRFTPFFTTLKKAIDDGLIGKLHSIVHAEYVGNVHQSHSFVRGNWRSSTESSPMLLQKSCHDMDILQWLVGGECTKVQSFGDLSYFTPANRPEGAADRCIDCSVRETCPYNAVKLYPAESAWFPCAATKKINPTQADIDDALANSRYGECVFLGKNDVVDHQVVNLQFDNDVTVSFTMTAFSTGGRSIVLMGTGGQLIANMDKETFTLYSFDTCETREIPITDAQLGSTLVSGHGGGDLGILNALYLLLSGHGDECKGLCTIRRSADNHLIVFAAEESRKNDTVVDFTKFKKETYEKFQ